MDDKQLYLNLVFSHNSRQPSDRKYPFTRKKNWWTGETLSKVMVTEPNTIADTFYMYQQNIYIFNNKSNISIEFRMAFQILMFGIICSYTMVYAGFYKSDLHNMYIHNEQKTDSSSARLVQSGRLA